MEIQEFLKKTSPLVQAIELENRQIARVEGLIELLRKFTQLKRLSLKSNRLSYIPKSISLLSTIEDLNISGNPIDDLQETVETLSNLPNLKVLNISISSTNDEEIIINSVTQLEFLNGRKIERIAEVVEEDNIEERQFECKEEDFQNLNYLATGDVEDTIQVLVNLKEFFGGSSPNTRGQVEMKSLIAQEFQKMGEIVWNAKEKVEQESDENLKCLIELKAKYSMYQLGFTKAIDISEKIDYRFFESMKAIHDCHALLFKQLSKVIQDQAKEIVAVRESIPPEAYYQIDRVRSLESQVESLTSENKKFLEKIIRLSKVGGGGGSELGNREQTPSKSSANGFRQQYSPISPGKQSISLIHNKQLTLHQLKETMQEIYSSKEWFDTKEQKQLHLPPQTLEMHMYEYLTQKYGLKSIVIEQASTIISALRKFTADDNDVTVFTKILKNECDENFRLAQTQLKKTIKELLSMHLKGKYPLKNALEQKTILEQRTIGTISLEEARDIINYMYNKEDGSIILNQAREEASLMPYNPVFKRGQKREDQSQDIQEKLNYTSLERIILDYQLKCHEIFLEPLINHFQQSDTDKDGVLSEEEFRNFMMFIPVPQSIVNQREKYLKILDPYTSGKITFSQIANLFSEEIITQDKQSISILQYLSLNQQK